jgi:hypothetical protein
MGAGTTRPIGKAREFSELYGLAAEAAACSREWSRLGDFVDTKENEGCIRAALQAAVSVVEIDSQGSNLRAIEPGP